MTTLRLPYKVSVVSDGELTLSIYNPESDNTITVGGENVGTITAYKGNYGYDLMFTVTDTDDAAFNLTGATVKFQMSLPTASTLKVDGSCILDPDPTTGQCSYTTKSADFDTVGNYEAQVDITVGGKNYTIGGITVKVLRKSPRGA